MLSRRIVFTWFLPFPKRSIRNRTKICPDFRTHSRSGGRRIGNTRERGVVNACTAAVSSRVMGDVEYGDITSEEAVAFCLQDAEKKRADTVALTQVLLYFGVHLLRRCASAHNNTWRACARLGQSGRIFSFWQFAPMRRKDQRGVCSKSHATHRTHVPCRQARQRQQLSLYE